MCGAYILQDRRGSRENVRSHYRDGMKERATGKHVSEPGDSSGYESSIQTDRFSTKKQETDEEQ